MRIFSSLSRYFERYKPVDAMLFAWTADNFMDSLHSTRKMSNNILKAVQVHLYGAHQKKTATNYLSDSSFFQRKLFSGN